MKQIVEKANGHLAQKLPFVIYKKPNNDAVIGLFQKNDTLFEINDFTEKGFVFASFDGNQTYIIPENQSEIIRDSINYSAIHSIEKKLDLEHNSAKNNFVNLVNKGIQAINSNEFKKVVLSRKESIDVVEFNLILAFENLVQLYPTTFVYCFYHPKIGSWLGATPEQLLKADESNFRTIALAGTQKDKGSNEVIWTNKEIDEQQYVTDYIVEKLATVALDVKVSKPYSIKAGSIWHIKTDISGTLKSDFGLQDVIKLLHPTPAVCGFPKDKSKAFILENEHYDRTFYTGFLGELNSSFSDEFISSDLFVNLRCMEIQDSIAHLFMGCGITKDSEPEKEWEESVNKSATMKKIVE